VATSLIALISTSSKRMGSLWKGGIDYRDTEREWPVIQHSRTRPKLSRVSSAIETKERSPTPIKKKIKFSSYIRKFRMEHLQSHI
jgi:hypothetical protein